MNSPLSKSRIGGFFFLTYMCVIKTRILLTHVNLSEHPPLHNKKELVVMTSPTHYMEIIVRAKNI